MMDTSVRIEVGQRIVYKGDMCNVSGRGAVVAVRQQKQIGRSYTMDWDSMELEPFDDSRSFDVALTDGRLIPAVSLASIGGEFSNKSCRFMLADGIADDNEIAELRANAAVVAAQAKAKADAKAAAFAKAKDEARVAGKALGLIPEDEFVAAKKRGSAAAYNLRLELKLAGIKCSVKQDSYTSIDVSLTDDADKERAKALMDKYVAGSFDGMTDCYDYSPGAWGSVFGDVRYVMGRSAQGYCF